MLEMVLSNANSISYWVSSIYERSDYFSFWGTVCMNQVLNVSKALDNKYLETVPLDYTKTSNTIINNLGTNNVSAMSISDMTDIPRATMI